jgi:hypothetical protein
MCEGHIKESGLENDIACRQPQSCIAYQYLANPINLSDLATLTHSRNS